MTSVSKLNTLEKILTTSTLLITDNYAEGTVKELTENNIRVNGFPLDKASLGVLIHLGFGVMMGEAPRTSARGRAAKVYRVAFEQECVFSTEHIEIFDENTTEEKEFEEV